MTMESDIMNNNSADKTKGEAAMTDYQFKTYVELRDKYDALLLEMDQLRLNSTITTEDGMTDYQFKRYEKLRERYEELKLEVSMLREVNVKLQIQVEMMRALTDKK